MSLKSELAASWQEWKAGAMACFLIAVSAVSAVVGSALFAALLLLPIGWAIGWKASDEAIYNLAFVFSVIMVPISINLAVRTIIEMASEAAVKERRE